MTLASQSAKIIYVGDGSTNTFAYPFKILAAGDLTVSRYTIASGSTSTLTLNTDYAVTGAGSDSGGNVLLTGSYVNLSSGYQLVIQREVDMTQETDYVENDPFPAETHEEALDKLTMITQQLQEQLDRAMVQDIAKTTPLTFPLPEADKILGWKNDVSGIENKTLVATDSLMPALGTSNGGCTVKVNLASTGFSYVKDSVRNVTEYGAVGDGVTDDTTAIQNAINNCSNGGIVYFPSGTYLISATISMNRTGVILQGVGSCVTGAGSGTTIKKSADGIDPAILLAANNWSMENIYVDCDEKTGDGVKITLVNSGLMKSVDIRKAQGSGCGLRLTQASDSEFLNVGVTDCYNNLVIDNTTGYGSNIVSFYNFYADNTKTGNNISVIVKNSTGVSFFGGAISPSDNSSILVSSGCSNVNFHNIYFECSNLTTASTIKVTGSGIKNIGFYGGYIGHNHLTSDEYMFEFGNGINNPTIQGMHLLRGHSITGNFIKLGVPVNLTWRDCVVSCESDFDVIDMATSNKYCIIEGIRSVGSGIANVILRGSMHKVSTCSANVTMATNTSNCIIENIDGSVSLAAGQKNIQLINCTGTISDANGLGTIVGGHRTGQVTLATGGTTTVVTYATPVLTTSARIFLTPLTSTAASTIQAGKLWVSARTTANFTITHINDSVTDKTYDYLAVSQTT